MPADARRAIVLLDSSDFDMEEATLAAQRILSRNKKGYFLMVEGDTHTDNVRQGLDRMVALDKTIAKMSTVSGATPCCCLRRTTPSISHCVAAC